MQQSAEGGGREAALESLRPQEPARDGLQYPKGGRASKPVDDECSHDVQDSGKKPTLENSPEGSSHETSEANNRISGLSADSRTMDSNLMPSFSSRRIEDSLSGDVIATMRVSPSTFLPWAITAEAASSA